MMNFPITAPPQNSYNDSQIVPIIQHASQWWSKDQLQWQIDAFSQLNTNSDIHISTLYGNGNGCSNNSNFWTSDDSQCSFEWQLALSRKTAVVVCTMPDAKKEREQQGEDSCNDLFLFNIKTENDDNGDKQEEPEQNTWPGWWRHPTKKDHTWGNRVWHHHIWLYWRCITFLSQAKSNSSINCSHSKYKTSSQLL